MIKNITMSDKQADILVVDDTPSNLDLLTEILKSNGYKVRPVTGGVAACRRSVKVYQGRSE